VLQVAGARDVAVEFNSFSKTFNMAGWRMGMAVGNSDALSALAQVKSNIDSGVFVALQEAAIVALQIDSDWLSARNQIYEERMGITFRGLQAAGLHARQPRATLYAWAQVPAGWSDSEAFAHTLLMRTGVAIAPGSFFGPAGKGYVRLSITAPTERLQEAMERLIRFVDRGA
jgi:LL-diaminopimelate aminotransferase